MYTRIQGTFYNCKYICYFDTSNQMITFNYGTVLSLQVLNTKELRIAKIANNLHIRYFDAIS